MGYTDAFGLLPLRQKIADFYLKKYKASIKIENIVITTGSSGAFLLAFTGCFDAGDTVAIASSGYPCYRNILQALGCNLASLEINSEFKLTAKELKQAIESRKKEEKPPLKGLILSSPSNPTGAMLTPEELKDLCQLCDEEGIHFLSDEIYHGISYGMPEATAITFSSNAFVINSFSKYYSMSGWRLGWMVIPDHMIDPINTLQQNMFINAPTISQTAALKCWESETIAELEQHVQKYQKSRTIILDYLKQIPEFSQDDAGKKDGKNHVAPPDGGFYVYVDLGEENVATGHGSVAMCEALLEECHVAFTPGTDFESLPEMGDRRFRISYAGGVETATEGLKQFVDFWPKWLERVKKVQQQQEEQ
mmetsp:Transcript_19895/g.48844  ORF Transcript_19895/g.48844 Transcript_19895/m.48844 type:complete len:364 (-) Transcript_19895:291-1382(-)